MEWIRENYNAIAIGTIQLGLSRLLHLSFSESFYLCVVLVNVYALILWHKAKI